MKVTRHLYIPEHKVLGFEFERGGAHLFWGYGPLVGSDVHGYRFLHSRGFDDRPAYLEGQKEAHRYARGLGFQSVHALYKTFDELGVTKTPVERIMNED